MFLNSEAPDSPAQPAPLQRTWWVAEYDRLTPVPVPFRLAPRRRGNEAQWFEEKATTGLYVGILMALIPGFFALVLAVAFASGVASVRDPEAWALFGCVLVFSGVVALVMSRAGWCRQLVMDAQSETVRILEVRRSGRIRRQVDRPLSDCQLRKHPVQLVIAHSNAGSPLLHWKGHAAVVHVGDDKFVLAVLKRSEEIDAYCRGLPTWLRLIESGTGPLIEASASKKLW